MEELPPQYSPENSSSSSSSSSSAFEDSMLYQDMIDSDDELPEIGAAVPFMYKTLVDIETRPSSPPVKRKGSTKGCRFVKRDYDEALVRFNANYFNEDCLFTLEQFKNRFRVSRDVFLRIYHRLRNHPLFIRKTDGLGHKGIHPKVKITAAFRYLAYGSAANTLDETYFLGIQTTIDALLHFCTAMNEEFGSEYMRIPNKADVARILEDSEARGWPGCLGSLDCTTWEWKNCPISQVGQYMGKTHEATLVMEALCSHDGWIWHSLCGMAGGFNDITVLDHSNLFEPYCTGALPPVNYYVNGVHYNMGYYLCDGIYPKWACLINAERVLDTAAKRNFTKVHEATRKDIECSFGRLKGKWHILERPARFHYREDMTNVMNCCVILHNMAVQDLSTDGERDYIPDTGPMPPLFPSGSEMYLFRKRYVQDLTVGRLLKADLIKHLWTATGRDE
ncbi:hypothetical protein ACHQM5_011888 [Ranunculus cassubicifolius]